MITKKHLKRILILSGFAILFASPVFAQVDTPRSITSDDFNNQRPSAKKPQGGKKSPINYKHIRKDKNPIRVKSGQGKPKSVKKAVKVFTVGVTIWKLRPPRPTDNGYKLPVRINGSLQEFWTPERVSPDTLFRTGDRVLFAVESSKPGFLYLVNSEIYRDGSMGAPSVIFPSTTGEDNYVKPGLLVNIPDRSEDFPYFNIEPKKNNYAGELVTIIISERRLDSLKIDENGKIKNRDELIKLEINAEIDIYSSEDAEDKLYTQAEAEAACRPKTRELVKEKLSINPCREKTRQLTREEPLPQTIYRVKTAAGQPAVAFIRLQVSN